MMGPGLRKLALTVHVTSSVGWLGAVVAFLGLAIVGLTGGEPMRVRAAYVAMDLVTWTVIVPASFASLLTGVIQALGTPWGLFRHWWVLIKAALTLVATLLLLVHTHPIHIASRAAVDNALATGDLRALRTQLVVDATAALLLLLTTTVLSIYKPRGVTRYGRRFETAA
jgi:hypothetical protein